MRGRIIALIGSVALTGCVGDDPRFPPLGTTDTRMPVVIDYYPHLVLHPVPHHRTDRVDSVDRRVGRHRDFGHEPAADPKASIQPDRMTSSPPQPHSTSDKNAEGAAWNRTRLAADLTALRAILPPDAGAYVALAHARRSKVKPLRNPSADDVAGTSSDVVDPGRGDIADNGGSEAQQGGYRLNFEDAEVKDVLQAVLGKVLGLNYTIAPNVTGRITISSSAPQSRTELLSTLETVLAMQGLSLTRSDSTYRVAPMSVGGGANDVSGNEPGFGISVVPLQYSSVASVNKLLSGFVTDADGIRIDTSRNTVIVRGPGPKRAEIVRAIKTLDGDWMHTQSVSMFELKRSHPEDLIPELTRIFASDKDEGSEGVIEFRPVKRLRAVMVISKNDTLIHRAGVWIRRLDHQDTSETNGIFVYRPRYRDARELSKLVNSLFGRGDTSAPGATLEPSSRNQTGQSLNGSPGQTSAGGLSSGAGLSTTGTGGGTQNGIGIGNGGNGGTAGGTSSSSSFGSLAGSAKGEFTDVAAASDDLHGGPEKLKLTADTSNNTIVAYTDGETYAKVKAVLGQLDIPPLQVAVNVIIAEVQLNDELKYGVQFFLNQSAKSGGSFGFSTSPSSVVSSAAQGAAAGVTQVISPASTGFNFISGGAASPNVIISALDSISKVHILSTPSIVVMENKAATLEVGNQVPVTTQQAQSNLTADAPTVNSVTYLDTGIILKIIPRVGQNGVVDMQIDQEISSVVPDATGSTTASLTPTISKRRIASDISVRSGQNVLLAGLVTDTRSKSNGQVPFVGQQLGNILGNTDNVFSRTELVMFLRPVIVRSGQDATEVTQDFKRGLHDIDLHPPQVTKP